MSGNSSPKSSPSVPDLARSLKALVVALVLLFGCQKNSSAPSPSESRWTIDTLTVLGPDTVFLSQPVVVTYTTLKILPGTILKFDSSAYLLVADSGRLEAIGTAQEPILFTGSPSWRGMILTAQEQGSELRHVIIENATGTANLLLFSDRKTRLTHVTFRSARHFGLALGAQAAPLWADSCTFLANQEVPLYTNTIGGLFRFGSHLVFEQNGDPRILVEGTSTTTVSGTLSISGYPIVFPEGWTVQTEVVIRPGVQIWLKKTLKVIGGKFEASGVLFQGENGSAWPGIVTIGGALRLDSVRIVRGGEGGDGALSLLGGTSIVIKRSIVDSSLSNGVYIATRVDTFSDNRIRTAAGYPILVSEPQYFPPIVNTVYENNQLPYIRVSGLYLQHSATWGNPGLPVLLNGLILRGDPPPLLTLLPGLTLTFLSSGKLEVGVEPSGLVAEGVTFTALSDSLGWTGIVIGPEITTAQIQNCIVEFGGYAKATVDSGNITIHGTTLPVITGSIIRYSQAYGIYLVGAANDPAYRAWLLSQNEFTGNSKGDIGPPGKRWTQGR